MHVHDFQRESEVSVADETEIGLSREALEFLRRSGRGFLMTLRPDGSPTIHPMTALCAEDRLAYNTYRKSAKAQNAARDPRTCTLLLSDYEDTHAQALVYKGRARALDSESLEVSRPSATRPTGNLSSSVPNRANARLREGKRILLGIEPEETRLLGADGEGG